MNEHHLFGDVFFSPNLGWKSSLKLGTKYLDTLNTCQSLGAPVTADLVLAFLAFQLKNHAMMWWGWLGRCSILFRKSGYSGWYRKVHTCPTWYLQFHSFGFLQVTHQYASLQKLASWTNSALKQIFQLKFLWFILGIFNSSNFRG